MKRKHYALVIALSFVMLSNRVGAQHPANDPEETLSVCDVLRDPVKYNGKIIAVRGYEVMTMHGWWIKEDCKESLKTAGSLEYPNLIWIANSRNDAMHSIPFERDYGGIEQESARILKQIKDSKNDRIWLTYVGLFETWPNIRTVVGRTMSGSEALVGFGYGGTAPGQLFLKTIKDGVVEHRDPPQEK